VVRHWHRFPREAAAALSLEVFKATLDEALRTLVWWKVSLPMAGGWNQMVYKVPSKPLYDSLIKITSPVDLADDRAPLHPIPNTTHVSKVSNALYNKCNFLNCPLIRRKKHKRLINEESVF